MYIAAFLSLSNSVFIGCIFLGIVSKVWLAEEQEYFNSKCMHDTNISVAGDGTDCYVLVITVF